MILSQVPILSPPPHLPFFKKKKKKLVFMCRFSLYSLLSFHLFLQYITSLLSFLFIPSFACFYYTPLTISSQFFTFSVTAAHSSPTAATVTTSIRFTHTTTITASSQHSCLTCQDLATISRKQPKLNEKFYWCIMGNIQLIPESVMMQMASFIV